MCLLGHMFCNKRTGSIESQIYFFFLLALIYWVRIGLKLLRHLHSGFVRAISLRSLRLRLCGCRLSPHPQRLNLAELRLQLCLRMSSDVLQFHDIKNSLSAVSDVMLLQFRFAETIILYSIIISCHRSLANRQVYFQHLRSLDYSYCNVFVNIGRSSNIHRTTSLVFPSPMA